MHKSDGIMSLISSRRETPSLLLYARPLGRFGRTLGTIGAVLAHAPMRLRIALGAVRARPLFLGRSLCLSVAVSSVGLLFAVAPAGSFGRFAAPPCCFPLGVLGRSLGLALASRLLAPRPFVGSCSLAGLKSRPLSAGALLIAVAIAVAVTLMPPHALNALGGGDSPRADARGGGSPRFAGAEPPPPRPA